MKKFNYGFIVLLAGLGIGWLGNDIRDYIINNNIKQFELDNYKSNTDYEIIIESLDFKNKRDWVLEHRIKVDYVYGEAFNFHVFPPELLTLRGSGMNHEGKLVRGSIAKCVSSNNSYVKNYGF